ncbi:hypothetical protein [Mangrovimonas aestuarii]|uniref:hypothetical protein n=1 Tax=Mangrovimonas aestuarii TaxID=3018443 RepID=UPI00237977C4|nr:hypothetical protein [Mangrovimonas aestuarii]
MKTKHFFIAIFFLVGLTTYAQSEKNNFVVTKTAVTELIFEAESLEDLANFDWKIVEEAFKNNDKDVEVTLVLAYKNKEEEESSKRKIKDFRFKFTGATSQLEILKPSLKKMFAEFDDVD